ncbi:DUF3574 domain-containing protein [Caulobacter sp. UNC279MFTsu5.1]|uniref:DUF3574 domain-containing protein n=1 Tax=Caulobacter sp. UNC279MFTsu5.1 TaxID=1502775 RepID=UPI0008E7F28A|nr:DUF3574 domain-containing protein [Caulobacter sp. UNC279MFTsu5.1]SFJ50216.1 Protein of unknown function [Caulobacter sp. UNC279MFTsu5.1]
MRIALALLLAGATLLCGCASLAPATCPAGLSPGRTAQLFFGRDIGDQVGVSDADFARFVDEELTPRFPDGLTILDAAGQWRGADGVVGREPSKVVVLALPGRTGGEDKLDAVRRAYETRFSQEAVLVTVQPVCMGF